VIWRWLPALVIALVLCGIGAYTINLNGRCKDAGGRVEMTLASRTGLWCVRPDGVVISP
jgi:hypothetical protein